jgi:hypothetical protein
MKKKNTEAGAGILGDGHVHIHECYRLPGLFESALDNFQAQHKGMPRLNRTARFLFLTESSSADWFGRWKTLTEEGRTAIKGFTMTGTGDSNCLRLEKQGGDSLFIVAGRQIVTGESLEVLALGLEEPYPDGRPIQTVLEELADIDCVRVLPWGAGKWLGKRGKIIRNLIADRPGTPLFLGDNGNRPFFWPLPSAFSKAGRNSIHNLPGSDPLPFAGQEKKAGSYGFSLAGEIDPAHPFLSFRTLLITNMTGITPYGKTERLIPFLHHQVAMQLSKKKK